MKNALLLPLRYLFGLVLCLAVAAGAFATLDISGGAWGATLTSMILASLVSALPFLALIALFLTGFQPARRKGNMPLSFLLLFLISAATLILGSWGADLLSPRIAGSALPPRQQAFRQAVISPLPNGAYYFSGDKKTGNAVGQALEVDFSAPGTADLLVFHERFDVPALGPEKAPAPPAVIASFATDGMATASLARPAGGLLPRVWIGIALAFFFTSLWIFPRVSRWPLFGAILALLAFRGSLVLCASLGSEAFRTVAASIVPRQVVPWIPHALLALAGLVLVGWDALAAYSKRKAGGQA